MNKIIYTLAFVLLLTQTILAQISWQQLPGPYGGDVRCIAVNPVNNYTYFGSNGAGIFYSTDQGSNWQRINTGILNLNVRALTFNSSGHFFAATFENGLSGIIRSTNNGVNWNYTSLTNKDVRTLVINSSGHIFAGTDTNGVYRSTDNGVSFTQINNGLTYSNVTSIAIKSTGEIFAGTRKGGVFRSTNNGDNWLRINTGLTDTNVNAVTINPVNGYVFVGTGNSNDIGAVYRTTNNGGIWTIMGLTNKWVKRIIINNYGNKIYAVCKTSNWFNHGLYKSTDGGGTWSGGPGTSEFSEINSLSLNNTDGNLYIGESNRMLRSTNDGGYFEVSEVGFTGQFVHCLIKLNLNNFIFAGCAQREVSRTTNSGINWLYSGGFSRFNINASSVNSFNILYAGGYDIANNNTTLWRSTNYGEGWNSLSFQMNTSIQSLTINYLDYIFIGTTGNGIYRSINNGANWAQIYLSNNNIYSLATDSIGTLFAGTGAGKIFRSTDNGYNWSQVYISPINNNNVKCLTFKSNNNIYAGLDTGGIIISTNNGVNWTQSNFTTSLVNAITFSSDGKIFVGTGKNGVYGSTNNGSSWVQFNTGLTNTCINAFVIDNFGYLYCGTNGSSVFKTLQPIGIKNISTEIPSRYSLSQNYPNPFNPTTNIKFDVARMGDVKIVVYDVMGREVQTLVNESLKPGTYTVDFDATNFPSGIYFYRLETHDFVQTNKMILLK